MSELEQQMLRYYEAMARAKGRKRPIPKRRAEPRPEFVGVDTDAALQAILSEISISRHVSEHGVKSQCRVQRVVDARQEFYYRASRETLISYTAIGKFCGGRDRTTVTHGVGAHCFRNGLQNPRDLDCTVYERKMAHNQRYKEQRAAP